jgi:hypothetical protein
VLVGLVAVCRHGKVYHACPSNQGGHLGRLFIPRVSLGYATGAEQRGGTASGGRGIETDGVRGPCALTTAARAVGASTTCRARTGTGNRAAPLGEDDGSDAMAAESQKGRQDGSDCTYDGQDGMDREAGGDERSSGDGGGGQYMIRYEKDGEMDRMLERQAELIGQYEEAQREWEKQYNENRNAKKVRSS